MKRGSRMLKWPLILVFLALGISHGQDKETIFAALLQKVKTPVPAKGYDFDPIPGPKSKGSKIGIIGAGISGVHMAYSLKSMGYTDVKILEKTNRVSGKAYQMNYRGIHNTMSTLWWTGDYETTLIPLLDKYGFLENGVGGKVNFSYWVQNDPDSSPALESGEYLLGTVMQLLKIQDPNQAYGRILTDLDKYIDLHQEFFGHYDFGFMKRPEKLVLEKLQGSFYGFLVSNDLASLVPLLASILSNNGYGPIYDLPVIYGMLWCTPNMVMDILVNKTNQLVDGQSIADLWPKIVEEEKIPVVFNQEITEVFKDWDNKIVVRCKTGEAESFDFLIWSGPLSEFERVAHSNVLNFNNRKYFESSLTMHVASSILDMKDVKRAGPTNVYLQNRDELHFSNKVVIDSDVAASQMMISRSDYEKGNFVYLDNEPPSKKWTLLALQYGNKTSQPSVYELQSELKSHYRKFGAKDVEVLYTRTYDYFPRWNEDETGMGYHWDMYDLQGQNNIWFIGGGMVFESCHHIIGYNQLLLANMQE